MRWARIDTAGIVLEIVDADARPDGCVRDDGTARVSAQFDGWTFRPQRFTSYQFLGRFTDAELELVRSYSVHDSAVWRLLSFAQAAQEIDTGDPVTIAGMDYLVTVAILTQARRDAILAA
jgi:hypothetical protein